MIQSAPFHTHFTLHHKVLSLAPVPSSEVPQFGLANIPVGSTVRDCEVLSLFREICNIGTLNQKTLTEYSDVVKRYKDETQLYPISSLSQKLLSICDVKLGLCAVEIAHTIPRLDHNIEMVEVSVEPSKIPDSVKLYFDQDDPKFFAKLNHYIGHEQVAMMIYFLLGRGQDCAPSLVIQSRKGDDFIQIQPCRSSDLADNHLKTLFSDSATSLTFGNYIWLTLEAILLGTFDDHPANSSVIDDSITHPSLSRFDHKCIAPYFSQLHLTKDAHDRDQFTLPFRTFLLESPLLNKDISSKDLDEIKKALKDVAQFFEIFPSSSEFYNRIKDHVLGAITQMNQLFAKNPEHVRVMDLFKTVYPSSFKMTELILEIYQTQSEKPLFRDFFELTNTPIPVLVGYFKAMGISKRAISDALRGILIPQKGTEPKTGKDMSNHIDEIVRTLPVISLEGISTLQDLSKKDEFTFTIGRIHSLIEECMRKLSGKPSLHRKASCVSTDDDTMFAPQSASLEESRLERQFSSSSSEESPLTNFLPPKQFQRPTSSFSSYSSSVTSSPTSSGRSSPDVNHSPSFSSSSTEYSGSDSDSEDIIFAE
jgi:hypothetical protein